MTDKPIFIQFNDGYRNRIININTIMIIGRDYITLSDGSLISIGGIEKNGLLDWLTQNGKLYSFDKRNRTFCKMEEQNND